MATDLGACLVPVALAADPWRAPKGDVKLFKGGPVRRLPPPEGGGHLAYVGLVAPCRFSGYSLGDASGRPPHSRPRKLWVAESFGNPMP